MASRTLVVRMTTAGRLDAGVYKCDITFSNPSNETALTQQLESYVIAFASQNNGTRESISVSYPDPLTVLYSETYSFLNLESMLVFAQQVGYPSFTRAIDFSVDWASLQALL
jgi:hypothetical protein